MSGLRELKTQSLALDVNDIYLGGRNVRIKPEYRTVVLQCYPSGEQEKLLRKAEVSALKFIDFSRREFQKHLYNKFKGIDGNIDPRMLTLLAQRFTGSMSEKSILVFDKDNSKFINENGAWFVEVKLFSGRNSRVRIPLAKTERKYYDVIENLSRFPFYITREDDKWFVYVSIKFSPVVNDIIVGVDFNFRKWVASPYYGQPIFFDVRKHEEKIDKITRKISRCNTLISRAEKNGDEEKLKALTEKRKELYRRRSEIVKLAHGEFLKKIKEKYGVCTIAVEEIDKMYKLTEKKDVKRRKKLTNIWLYSKTALRKFVLRALSKGFNVVEVNPFGTSTSCHWCFSKLKIKGKRGRIVECPNECFKSYNRDLNAARNIAYRAWKPHMKTMLEVVKEKLRLTFCVDLFLY